MPPAALSLHGEQLLPGHPAIPQASGYNPHPPTANPVIPLLLKSLPLLVISQPTLSFFSLVILNLLYNTPPPPRYPRHTLPRSPFSWLNYPMSRPVYKTRIHVCSVLQISTMNTLVPCLIYLTFVPIPPVFTSGTSDFWAKPPALSE